MLEKGIFARFEEKWRGLDSHDPPPRGCVPAAAYLHSSKQKFTGCFRYEQLALNQQLSHK